MEHCTEVNIAVEGLHIVQNGRMPVRSLEQGFNTATAHACLFK